MKEIHAAQKDFFTLESLGIVVNPKCGRCKYSKCPVPGVGYMQHEEVELQLIKENLKRNPGEDGWITSYPLLHPRELLKGDRTAGMRSLLSTERSFKKDPIARRVYKEQIEDMVNRGVARKVSPEEMRTWTGVVNCIPHLAVQIPKSVSTPVRIMFDASRPQNGGPSLNTILAKGPD